MARWIINRYTIDDVVFTPHPDGSGWAEATLDLRDYDEITVLGKDALRKGQTVPRRTVQTFYGPGILTLYRAPNGDVRWFSNALEVV
jgi:hypothetical protein